MGLKYRLQATPADVVAGEAPRRVLLRPHGSIEGQWDVIQYDRGTERRRGEEVGFVFRPTTYDAEMNPTGKADTWNAARHTYSGRPAITGRGYATREDAALALFDAYPFPGAKATC